MNIPSFLIVAAHNLQVARFEISKITGTSYSISISVDRDDLVQAVTKENNGSNSIDNQIINYLLNHFELKFNGSNILLNLKKVQYEKDMIYVGGEFESTANPIIEVEITNTCLLDAEDQNNIVEFDLYGKKRSFRLTNERTYTKFEYE